MQQLFCLSRNRATWFALVILSALVAAETARAELVMVRGYVPAARKISRINSGAKAGTYCTQDVKKCGNGTYVSRDPGASCSFRACTTTTALN